MTQKGVYISQVLTAIKCLGSDIWVYGAILLPADHFTDTLFDKFQNMI